MTNAWASRSSSAGGANGPRAEQAAPAPQQERLGEGEQYTSVNGFNAAEVKAFLSKDAGGASYKVLDGSSASSGRGSGGAAWGAKRKCTFYKMR